MLNAAARYLRAQNAKGNYQNLYRLAKYIKSFYHFHSIHRFKNSLELMIATSILGCVHLRFHESVVQRIFYIIKDSKKGTIRKIPTASNHFSNDLVRSLRIDKNYRLYRERISCASDLPHIGDHVPVAISVRRDGGYVTPFIPGINLAEIQHRLGDSVNEPPLGIAPANLKIALEQLTKSILTYVESGKTLHGDWKLHNLIYSHGERKIFNVDLEGFYSFPAGKPENDVPAIMDAFDALHSLLELREKPF